MKLITKYMRPFIKSLKINIKDDNLTELLYDWKDIWTSFTFDIDENWNSKSINVSLVKTKNLVNIKIKMKNNEIKNSLIQNFFNIWVTKELINRNYFEYYYKTFLDKENQFDNTLVTEKLDYIYNLISKNDATTIRPNNLNKLSNENIANILNQNINNYKISDIFWSDLLTYMEWNTIKMEYDYNITKENIEIIKNGLLKYLDFLFNDWKKLLNESEDLINKTIKEIKKDW